MVSDASNIRSPSVGSEEPLDHIIEKLEGAGQRDDVLRVLCALRDNGLVVFRDEVDDACGVFRSDARRWVYRLDDSSFTDFVVRLCLENGSVPSSAAVRRACSLLRACANGRQVVHERFAWHDGTVWVDLADDRGRAVRIAAGGWEVCERAPVYFRRYQGTRPLPEPARGGSVDLLRPLLPLGEEDFRFAVVWMATVLVPAYPRPILLIVGPQGAAKTSMTRVIVQLLDPREPSAESLPSRRDDLVQAMAHRAVAAFDNVERLSDRQADFLCRAVTGEGVRKRKFFTDDDDVLFRYRRAVVLNGINLTSARADLRERLLPLEVLRIPDQHRRTEQELDAYLQEHRPQILGALYDVLAEALARLDAVRSGLSELPRMADWAVLAAAAAEAIRWPRHEFLAAYKNRLARLNRELGEEDPLVQALVAFLRQVRGEWEGRMSELLGELKAVSGRDAKRLPKSPSALSRAIHNKQVVLGDVGVVVEELQRSSDTRRCRITYRPAVAEVSLELRAEETAETVEENVA